MQQRIANEDIRMKTKTNTTAKVHIQTTKSERKFSICEISFNVGSVDNSYDNKKPIDLKIVSFTKNPNIERLQNEIMDDINSLDNIVITNPNRDPIWMSIFGFSMLCFLLKIWWNKHKKQQLEHNQSWSRSMIITTPTVNIIQLEMQELS